MTDQDRSPPIPTGYIAAHCQRCGAAFTTLAAQPGTFCSLGCAFAALEAAPAPRRARLLRAVRCSFCEAPLQVAPQQRPPYRCLQCFRRAGPRS